MTEPMAFEESQLSNDAFLGGKLNLLQPREGYRAATDPVLLAAACPAKAGEHVLDLGCGVGTAAFCLASRVNVALTGVELQADYAELARMNAARNGHKMEVHCADIAALPATVRAAAFDHVIVNPPYYRPGSASRDAGKGIALHEDTPLDKWLDIALRRTAPKGWLTMIHLTERLGDILTAINGRAGLTEIKPIAGRSTSRPKRILIRFRKGQKSQTILYNPLILHKGDHHKSDGDDFSDIAKRLLRHGEQMHF